MENTNAPSEWDSFVSQLQSELDASRRNLKEINLLLEQSQIEMNRITQRNKQVAEQLQQIVNIFDSAPREDIRSAYKDMLDAQQRLLVMKGQLEKMQSDQSGLEKYVSLLEKVNQMVTAGAVKGVKGRDSTPTLEMLINAQESERQRLSRQMHDGPAQALSNFIVQVEIAARLLDMDPARAKEELSALKTSAMGTFQKIRGFISDLRPMMLDDLGLIPTVKRYLDTFREQSGVETNLTVKGVEKRFENYLEVFIFRAIQELVGSCVRHNQDNPGKIQVSVQVILEEHLVKVTVSDNGKGYEGGELLDVEGIGLKLIKERIEMLGGDFDLDSATGKGSRITLQVPVVEVAEKS